MSPPDTHPARRLPATDLRRRRRRHFRDFWLAIVLSVEFAVAQQSRLVLPEGIKTSTATAECEETLHTAIFWRMVL